MHRRVFISLLLTWMVEVRVKLKELWETPVNVSSCLLLITKCIIVTLSCNILHMVALYCTICATVFCKELRGFRVKLMDVKLLVDQSCLLGNSPTRTALIAFWFRGRKIDNAHAAGWLRYRMFSWGWVVWQRNNCQFDNVHIMHSFRISPD